MSTETTRYPAPESLADVYRRYRELAPDPDPSSPDVALQLSRHLLVTAVRALADPDAVSLACSAFAALHAFEWLRQSHPDVAARKACAVATACRDADVGEWLWNYAAAMDIDPDALLALAETEHRLRASAKAPENRGNESWGTWTADGTPEASQAVLASPARPSPAELWQRSGGNRDLYRDLLAEHGHLLKPGDEGYDEAAQWPPCGWKPGRNPS